MPAVTVSAAGDITAWWVREDRTNYTTLCLASCSATLLRHNDLYSLKRILVCDLDLFVYSVQIYMILVASFFTLLYLQAGSLSRPELNLCQFDPMSIPAVADGYENENLSEVLMNRNLINRLSAIETRVLLTTSHLCCSLMNSGF